MTNPVPRNSASPATPCSGGVPPRGTLYDFTGDGRTDWTTFRLGATTGAPVRWRVVGNPASPVPNAAFIREFDYGLTGDRIVPADYVGDRKTDMTVWRSGIYYVAQFPPGAGGITLDRAVQWGQFGDNSGSEGDYDGDGKVDYTVKRANIASNTMRAVQFGAPIIGFLPPTLVAWRGRTGTAADAGVWYIRNTATGTATGTRFGIGGAGGAADLAVRGDYDGDGRHDIGVYRRSNQTFYVLSSSNNSLLFQQSGAAGDFPLANQFAF